MTKSLDQILFQFYAQNDGLRITDLHQGIVWGTHTEQTRRHVQLINRFDYDGDYGTVLNRFLIQAAIGYPLTVHGTGGQTRAFIHIQDSVRCIELALEDAPKRGERVKIFNQMTETHRVRDLAGLVAELTGAKIAWLPNPRKEAAENDLVVRNDQFRALGLDPITLRAGLLAEVVEVAKKYAYRVDRSPHPLRLGLDQGDRPARRARPRAPRTQVGLTTQRRAGAGGTMSRRTHRHWRPRLRPAAAPSRRRPQPRPPPGGARAYVTLVTNARLPARRASRC